MRMIGKQTPQEISLYIHIPFCKKKCPYCHFFVLPDEIRLKTLFLQSLEQEWKLYLPQLQDKRIVSIYLGGGTPSRLTPSQIGSILDMIRKAEVTLSNDCEITLEVNPEDIHSSFAQEWKGLGINRVSMGVQSLSDSELLHLGRGHLAAQAIRAIERVSASGIDHISIDLMYDLPHQTVTSWESTLSFLPQLPITHLSLYNLTLEPHTVFFKHQATIQRTLPKEETSFLLLEMALSHLEAAGLIRYEISAFAKNGLHSRHNSGYWTARPFLGLGPSAFSYWGKRRFQNVPHLNRYARSLEKGEFPIHFEEQLTYPRSILELLAIHLRLIAGVDLSLFERTQGIIPQATHHILLDLENKGWLLRQDQHIRLTRTGQLFYDSVAEEVIGEAIF